MKDTLSVDTIGHSPGYVNCIDTVVTDSTTTGYFVSYAPSGGPFSFGLARGIKINQSFEMSLSIDTLLDSDSLRVLMCGENTDQHSRLVECLDIRSVPIQGTPKCYPLADRGLDGESLAISYAFVDIDYTFTNYCVVDGFRNALYIDTLSPSGDYFRGRLSARFRDDTTVDSTLLPVVVDFIDVELSYP